MQRQLLALTLSMLCVATANASSYSFEKPKLEYIANAQKHDPSVGAALHQFNHWFIYTCDRSPSLNELKSLMVTQTFMDAVALSRSRKYFDMFKLSQMASENGEKIKCGGK